MCLESADLCLGCELAGSYLGCNTPSACRGPACAGRDRTQNLFYWSNQKDSPFFERGVLSNNYMLVLDTKYHGHFF